MPSGPAEYIYLVLGEWWPQKQECVLVWHESGSYVLIFETHKTNTERALHIFMNGCIHSKNTPTNQRAAPV